MRDAWRLLCRTISFLISNLSRQAERRETLENIGEDVFAIAIDQPFRFPATFTFVLRAFTTLEGVSKGLDPEYNFANEATPYARALLDLEGTSDSNRQLAVAELQRRAVRLGSDAVALPSRVEYLETTLRRCGLVPRHLNWGLLQDVYMLLDHPLMTSACDCAHHHQRLLCILVRRCSRQEGWYTRTYTYHEVTCIDVKGAATA